MGGCEIENVSHPPGGCEKISISHPPLLLFLTLTFSDSLLKCVKENIENYQIYAKCGKKMEVWNRQYFTHLRRVCKSLILHPTPFPLSR